MHFRGSSLQFCRLGRYCVYFCCVPYNKVLCNCICLHSERPRPYICWSSRIQSFLKLPYQSSLLPSRIFITCPYTLLKSLVPENLENELKWVLPLKVEIRLIQAVLRPISILPCLSTVTERLNGQLVYYWKPTTFDLLVIEVSGLAMVYNCNHQHFRWPILLRTLLQFFFLFVTYQRLSMLWIKIESLRGLEVSRTIFKKECSMYNQRNLFSSERRCSVVFHRDHSSDPHYSLLT